jgi:hypothetical protein
MASKVSFFAVRHVADLIRNEPRNIGVVVTDGALIGARFVGETAPGELDLRRVSPSIVPDRHLYAEWHHRWRSLVARHSETSDTAGARAFGIFDWFRVESTPAFSVGPASDWYIDSDVRSPADLDRLTHEIFQRMVDPAAVGFTAVDANATGGPAKPAALRSIELAEAIAATFRARHILETSTESNLFAEYPVRVDRPVRGRNPVPHVPKFVQENGRRFVMEQVDFNVPNAEASREHAAYTAYMLSDIGRGSPVAEPDITRPVEAIALVNRVSGAEARRDAGGAAKAVVEAQEYGLAVLSDHNEVRVVHWDDSAERLAFIEERVAVARGAAA